MSSLAQILESAWEHRWNQRIEPALQGLAEAQGEAGWAELLVDQLSTRKDDRDAYIEALLLKSSLLRAQGYRQKSSALLAKLQAQVDQSGTPRSFRLLFELGLDHWIDQDLASSLEYFLLAERKARTDTQRLFAASNVLWCLEALDLDRRETEAKVAKLLGSAGASHVAELWAAYLARKNFFQKMEAPEGEGPGLASFFRQWALSLPYMGGSASPALSQDYLWQGSYRLRTLARIWIPADQHATRVSDAIDRLYLWVWLAMAGRPEMTKEKILYTLESVLHDFEDQSKENLLLFRNALGWALVLYPALKARVQSVFERLAKISSANYPVLEAEFDLMLWLSKQAPPGARPIFDRYSAFRKIHEEMQSSLPFLQEKLTPILARARHYDLVIDQSREEILLPAKGKLVASAGLTKLLSLLIEKDEVHLDSLNTFEPFNLVYRARKLLGPNTIVMKRKVLSRGPHWPKTLVLQDVDLPTYQLSALKPSLVESDVHLQAAKALLPGSFRRKELEKKLVVSKASANRMIENWLKEKKVLATGRAKATVYQWLEEAL